MVLSSMTNVSKQKLDPKYEKTLLRQFSSLFANASEQMVEGLLEDILTPSEQVMLLKRTAIILMLAEEYSTYKISKTLKVSDATVRNLQHRYRQKEFNQLLRLTSSSKFDSDAFWQTVDKLLRLGMPPMGRGRWQHLKR